MAFSLTIPGNPIPKARHRTGDGHAYTPKRTREYEAYVREYAALVWRREPMQGRLGMTLRFFRKTAHRCDLTNLAKSVEDALQDVVFLDDEQIDVQFTSKSIDRDNPRVEIIVEEL